MILLLVIIILVWFLIPKYKKPQIIPNFISDEEIEHIKKEASGKFKISTIDQNETTDKKIRDSYGTITLKELEEKGLVPKNLHLFDRIGVNEYQLKHKTDWWMRMSV